MPRKSKVHTFEEARNIMSLTPRSSRRHDERFKKEGRPILAGECPTCRFPSGQPGFLMFDVRVGHPNYGDLIRCPVCWEGARARKLEEISGLSAEMLGWTLYDFFKLHGKMEAHAAADRFASDPKGWLTIWGGYGVGKTYLLAAMVNACRLRGIAASYRVLPELLNQLRATYEDDAEVGFDTMIDDLKSVTVLALDEMDQPGRTPWALQTVFEILDSRYRNMREVGTVLAQNSDPALDPDGPLGYLYSRIHDGRFEVVEISGGDVRPLMKKEE